MRRRLFEIGGDLHILAAIERADFVHASDFLGKAHAAGAVDAASHDRLDQRAHIFFGHGALVFLIARAAAAIGNRLILQIALAALIADWAIERVVDEQELHHPFAGLLDHRAIGADFLTIGSRQRAGGLRLGRPGLHFDQTHAAVARDAEPLVIAEARDFLARQLARLQHSRARRDFDFLTVYGDFRHYSAASCLNSSLRGGEADAAIQLRNWIASLSSQ